MNEPRDAGADGAAGARPGDTRPAGTPRGDTAPADPDTPRVPEKTVTPEDASDASAALQASSPPQGPIPGPSPGPTQSPSPGLTPSPSPGPPPVPPVPSPPPMPGEHRGGFSRLPTAPVDVTATTAPAEPGTEEQRVEWLMPEASLRRALAGWALAFSIAGLVVSLFVGWGFPIGLVGVVAAIVALRRPLESRSIAVWALVLGLVSVLYSAGWLLWAASRTNISG